ncbi:sporulation related protein [Dyadobacter jejuensis]|uniref:Sporulation related protein n=2 Tax=Dyadobacter jejuensis TaxID=1082580 RepID=A0A316AME9_9BACT|nr:sporulation related protein [Dyadobacter jejuensis]
MEAMINSLVKEHEFLVIPGFGALLSHEVLAYFDTAKGKFVPSTRKLSFNEFVSQDDGFLANYLSRKESITHQEAILKIKAFVLSLRTDIAQSGSTEINGVGTFGKNVEGKLVFEPNKNQFIKDEWYGFEPIPVKLVERNNPVVSPMEAVEEVAFYEQQSTETTSGSIKWYQWASAAVLAGFLCYFSFFWMAEGGSINKSDLNPFVAVTQPLEVDPTPVETHMEIVPEEAMASAVVDSLVVEPEPKEEMIEVQKIVEVKEPKYYLIAGAFKGRKQAQVLMDRMKQEGYTEACIVGVDKYSSKYKVAVQGFDDQQLALKANVDLKKIIGEPGWVYKVR